MLEAHGFFGVGKEVAVGLCEGEGKEMELGRLMSLDFSQALDGFSKVLFVRNLGVNALVGEFREELFRERSCGLYDE